MDNKDNKDNQPHKDDDVAYSSPELNAVNAAKVQCWEAHRKIKEHATHEAEKEHQHKDDTKHWIANLWFLFFHTVCLCNLGLV